MRVLSLEKSFSNFSKNEYLQRNTMNQPAFKSFSKIQNFLISDILKMLRSNLNIWEHIDGGRPLRQTSEKSYLGNVKLKTGTLSDLFSFLEPGLSEIYNSDIFEKLRTPMV